MQKSLLHLPYRVSFGMHRVLAVGFFSVLLCAVVTDVCIVFLCNCEKNDIKAILNDWQVSNYYPLHCFIRFVCVISIAELLVFVVRSFTFSNGQLRNDDRYFEYYYKVEGKMCRKIADASIEHKASNYNGRPLVQGWKGRVVGFTKPQNYDLLSM